MAEYLPRLPEMLISNTAREEVGEGEGKHKQSSVSSGITHLPPVDPELAGKKLQQRTGSLHLQCPTSIDKVLRVV